MKLGSLFDGSGGFPLAGSLCGIEPVWAAEVEPYPIAVTRSRFPRMKHLGDVTKVNGADVEPVDIITFGSPCQDLSVAGKRAGLKHKSNGDDETTRSGLFLEAIRIIKEMRGATNGLYPRFAVWENVFGAFSSNGGEDFHTVLNEIVGIIEPDTEVPPMPKGGWPYADCYVGDGWSVAYRTFDAQYWGVPQRRRRIYLVADFAGERAAEILFEREGLRGYFETGRTPWKGTASDAERGAGKTDNQPTEPYTLKIRLGCDGGGKGALVQTNISATLATNNDQYLFQPVSIGCFKAGNGAKANGIGYQEECSPTLSAAPSGTNQVPAVCVRVYDGRGNGDGEIVNTLTGDHENRITDYTSIVVAPVYCLQGNGIDRADTAGCNGKGVKEDICYTLNTIDRPAVVYAIGNGHANQTGLHIIPGALTCMHDQQAIVIDRAFFNQGQNAKFDPQLYEDGTCPTLVARGPAGVCVGYIVRRLTPTECARLQGFPDAWGIPEHKDDFSAEEYEFWLAVRNTYAALNGKTVRQYTRRQMLRWYNKLHTDSAEYKMWGNGIALPCALYVMQGIADAVNHKPCHVAV